MKSRFLLGCLIILFSCAEPESPAVRPNQSTTYSGKKNSKSENSESDKIDNGSGTVGKDKDEAADEKSKTPTILDIQNNSLNILPDTLAELNIYDTKGVLNSKIPFLNYDVNAPLWSDGAEKKRSLLLPKGGKITLAPFGGNLVLPVGTLFIKHFTSPVDKSPIETRVILKRPNSTWDFATYKWSADGSTKRITTPEILSAGTNKAWPDGYRIPAENECVKCHNPNVVEVLGFRPEQLKGVLEKLGEENIISSLDLDTFKKAVPQANPKDLSLTAEARAKAYLQVNCAQCHQANGSKSSLSLAAKSLDWASLLKSPMSTTGDVLTDSPVITPGAPDKSKLYLRFIAAKNRMPPISVVQDPTGEEILKNWILSIPSTCTVADTSTCSASATK